MKFDSGSFLSNEDIDFMDYLNQNTVESDDALNGATAGGAAGAAAAAL